MFSRYSVYAVFASSSSCSLPLPREWRMSANIKADNFSSPSKRIISSRSRSSRLLSASFFAFLTAKVIIVANTPPVSPAEESISGSNSPNISIALKAGISGHRGSPIITRLLYVSLWSKSSSLFFICLTILFTYTLPAAHSSP